MLVERLTKVAMLIGVAVAGGALGGTDMATADPRTEQLRELLQAYADQGALSGAVLVAEGDSLIFRGGFGMADRELGVPAAPEHRFIIGSMTKAFTALLTLQEVARGRIALDSPAVSYWPEFPDPAGRLITVRHLLTHRSGLPHWGAVAGFLDSTARLPHRPADIVARYAALGLEFPPGARESYSSIGYLALGVVLERITDSSLATLLQARVFAPLGMGASSLDDGTAILPGRARSYRYSFLAARYENAEPRDPGTTWSTGGIVTTIDDLWRWGRAIVGGRLLPDSLYALLFDPAEGGAAYGWRRDDSGPVPAFGHGGQVTGYRSEIALVPSRRQVIVILGNLRDLDTRDIVGRIRGVLAGERPERPRRSLMKAVLEAAASGGPDSAVARFREILASEADNFDTPETGLLLAAVELRSDDACDRAAPLFELWLATYRQSRYAAAALAGAADCRLRLGDVTGARQHASELGRRFPEDSRLGELLLRLRR